jgi:dTMP kinase
VTTGIFITFEGLDGAGKTTQLRRLASTLLAEGHQVVTLRQPGGTPLGDRIRALLLDSRIEAEFGDIAPSAEMALMFADRAQSLHQVILPALSRGDVVLCDRYTDSSEAYQGAGRNLGVERVLAMHRAACDNIQPELTILLLPPLEASLKRARRRNSRQDGPDENRFEREGDDFYRRVYDQYRAIAERDRQRVFLLDQPGSIDEIASQILTVVRERLQNRDPEQPPA